MAANGPAILVIDDEEIIREAFEALLGGQGYTVRSAETAQRGLDMIAEASFDAVLLDIGLPDRDGLDVLEEIRRFDEHLPVIVVTAKGTIENAVTAWLSTCVTWPRP